MPAASYGGCSALDSRQLHGGRARSQQTRLPPSCLYEKLTTLSAYLGSLARLLRSMIAKRALFSPTTVCGAGIPSEAL